MKKTLVVMSMLFLASLNVDVFAIGNIGTPTAELKAGQWSIGGTTPTLIWTWTRVK